jgi:hypothetical protein
MTAFYRQLDGIQKTESRTRLLSPETSMSAPPRVWSCSLADTLAAGGTLIRSLCVLFAVFWTLRLLVATFVFDLRPSS